MRLRPLQSLVFAGLLYVVMAPQLACTVIGALAGGASDATTRPIPAGDAVTVKHGQRLVVTLRDGQRLTGVFRDTTRLGDPEYDALWQRWLTSAGHVTSVSRGDAITLVDGAGEWQGTFVGYHYRSLEVAPAPGEVRRVPMGSLRTLRGPDQREWDGTTLEALDAAGALPSRMAIVLDVDGQIHGIAGTGESRRPIALSEIQTVSVGHGGHGALVGAIIGLTADVLVVTAIGKGLEDDGGCISPILFWPGFLSELPGVELTDRPYDRLAGRFLEPTRGTSTDTRHAAPAR